MKPFCSSILVYCLLAGMPLFGGEIPTVVPAEVGMSAELAEVGKFMEKQVADKKMAGGSVLIAAMAKSPSRIPMG